MIEPLDIHLEEVTEREYALARTNYLIAREDHATGELEWNQRYPLGLDDYRSKNGQMLTSTGEQMLIDKINEVIKALNEKE